MKLHTLIEIDEIPTEVVVHYGMYHDEPEIDKITDAHTGDAICPDLLGQTKTADLLDQCHEHYADYRADKKRGRVNYNALRYEHFED